MNWVLLVMAGICETGFVACLGKARQSVGTISMLWYTGFIVCLGLSMYLLMKATEVLPLGIAYAVWTGKGAVGAVLTGILVFKEPVEFWRMFFLTTLIVSI